MRILFLLAGSILTAAAQSPSVRIANLTRPASSDFRIGDRFEVAIVAAANQPVTVRTTMYGRTDWGPVVGWTDLSGRWSTTGAFEKSDYGDWREIWTVGGKLADPVVHFSVTAPCLPGGFGMMSTMSRAVSETCDTPNGQQTFGTPSDPDPFRTPDGRLVPGRGRSKLTAEEYQAEIMESRILGDANIRSRHTGDEAATAIAKIIEANALTETETRNVLTIVRAAFEGSRPSYPTESLRLLRNLSDATNDDTLKRSIAETAASLSH
jgi:hypothetical protein